MLFEQAGQIVDRDPKQVALEESIIEALRRNKGKLTQRDLWFRSSAQRHSRELFVATLDALVLCARILRQPTKRINQFIYCLPKDKRRSERAAARRAIQIQEPLRPEAA